MMPLSLQESLMSMVGFFNLKDRPVSFSQKRGDLVCVVSSLNLLHLVSFPAETKQVSWELYPGKSD
jgi:hypothetical protein